MTITLPPALERWVREKVTSGLYANETEVVCEALRHGFAQDAVAAWIREQAKAGFAQLDDGEFEDITREELMARLARRRRADDAGDCGWLGGAPTVRKQASPRQRLGFLRREIQP